MVNAHQGGPPALVFVELTKRCDLACVHCRASAGLEILQDELTVDQVRGFLEELVMRSRRKLHVIYTGGNIALVRDLDEFMSMTRNLGLSFSLSPSPSEYTDLGFLERARNHGAASISTSIDGLQDIHDRIRGSRGSFSNAVRIIREAKSLGVPVQVNTLVALENIMDLPHVFTRIRELGVEVWELFFLINTGRGRVMNDLEAEQVEDVLHWLAHIRKYFRSVRTVEAPQFSRILAISCSSVRKGNLFNYLVASSGIPVLDSDHPGEPVSPRGRTLFLSSEGEVYPSGFLPVSLGSIRNIPFGEELSGYLENDFRVIGENENGRCDICFYSTICGGSRARSYAYTGDIMQPDPSCLLNAQLLPLIRNHGGGDGKR